MRIVFLVERPTQFEAPFFRYAASDPAHSWRVLFTGAEPAAPVFDPELGAPVAWGIDLLNGYPHATVPTAAAGSRGFGTSRPDSSGAGSSGFGSSEKGSPRSRRSGNGLGTGRASLRRWLKAELRRDRCDLLIVNGYTRRDYLLAAWLARRAGIATALRLDSVLPAAPVEISGAVVASGGAAAGAAPLSKRLLFALALKPFYQLFLGVGSRTLDYLAACGVPPDRRGLFPYAVDVEHFRTGAAAATAAGRRAALRASWGVPPQARVVLALAKLNAREGPWDLVGDALARLPADVWVVIAGDGPQRAAMESAAAGAQPGGGAQRPRVRFVGYVPYPDLPALYTAADLFVHAAHEERWGVSVAEALACGLPVVTSSGVGAATDLLAPPHNGGIYPSGDGAALAQQIVAALALDRADVAAVNRRILASWDYAATWRHLLDAGSRIVRRSAP